MGCHQHGFHSISKGLSQTDDAEADVKVCARAGFDAGCPHAPEWALTHARAHKS